MNEYPEGTLAIATVRGIAGIVVLRRITRYAGPEQPVYDWAHSSTGIGYTCSPDDEVAVKATVTPDHAWRFINNGGSL